MAPVEVSARVAVLVALAIAPVHGGDAGSGPTTTGFVEGQVCWNVDYKSNASSMLRGQHLKVYEINWPPFAVPDATAPHGWRGFNIDLMERAAFLLGCTFEIHEMTKATSELTWTDALFRATPESDLVLSYWARRVERLNSITMLSGHIDMSATLVARLEDREMSLADAMLSPFRPFSPNLWIGLLAVVVCAGVVDYMLEVRTDPDAKLGWAIYEYFAGCLFGGFECK